MKKYIKSLFFALIIGLFLSKIVLSQYDDYNGIKVYNSGETFYFIQYGVFSSKESMEENTINLQNYVYNITDDKYYVYVGITLNNKDKIVEYYKSLGYDTIIKEYGISNKDFIEKIKSLDETLKNTTDITATSSIISKGLELYEEVVINGNKNKIITRK